MKIMKQAGDDLASPDDVAAKAEAPYTSPQGSSMIDTAFDFRSDASGKDPDFYSPTLRRYHKHLWSRDLPSGPRFNLVDTSPGIYLHHRSALGEFQLASDSVIPTYTRWTSMRGILGQLSEEQNEAFRTASCTIGGMLVYPGNKVDGKLTINAARGFNPKISDRLDLTLESIRRHYCGEPNPLSDVLGRYAAFFSLFGDFRGYVDFFYLQDLVFAQSGCIRFFNDFDNFATRCLPRNLKSYSEYRDRSLEFVEARNRRIAHAVSTSSA